MEVCLEIPPRYGGATEISAICIYTWFFEYTEWIFFSDVPDAFISNSPNRPMEKNHSPNPNIMAPNTMRAKCF